MRFKKTTIDKHKKLLWIAISYDRIGYSTNMLYDLCIYNKLKLYVKEFTYL